MPRAGLDAAAVVAAAAELADANGLEDVTLASLAKKLNIRPPSLYNHVKGMTGLRLKLAEHALNELHAQLTLAARGCSDDEAVSALARAYVGFVRAHPGLYEAAQVPSAQWDEAVSRAGERIVDLLVGLLAACYDLRGDAALHAVRGLRSLLHGFASLEQRGGFGLPLDLDRSLELMVATFLAGIGEMKRAE